MIDSWTRELRKRCSKDGSRLGALVLLFFRVGQRGHKLGHIPNGVKSKRRVGDRAAKA